jgi:hypothetical protein
VISGFELSTGAGLEGGAFSTRFSTLATAGLLASTNFSIAAGSTIGVPNG